MFIESNDYLTIANFASKVGSYANQVNYYVKTGRIEFLDMNGIPFIHKDLVDKWPPQPNNKGRKLKQKD